MDICREPINIGKLARVAFSVAVLGVPGCAHTHYEIETSNGTKTVDTSNLRPGEEISTYQRKGKTHIIYNYDGPTGNRCIIDTSVYKEIK